MSPGTVVSIVDDDESIRESLPELLRSFGLNAMSFSSAADFLASGYIGKTSCLILDVAMPDMSGPELQQELVRLKHDIPIVFITAHSNEDIKPQAMRNGAVAWLIKPFSESAILAAVRTALNKK